MRGDPISGLPVVTASWVQDPTTQRDQAALAIQQALEELGCFVLRIEGAAPTLRAATQQWSRLYAQPEAIKQSCQSDRDEGGGWLRLRDEPVYMSHMSSAELDAPRCKEQFGCGPTEDMGRWPDEGVCPGFRRDVSACARLVSESSRALLGSFEALLGQEPGFLRYQPGYLALTSYPGSRHKAKPGEPDVGLHEHSDAVVFTMLRQTERALQVRTIGGDWLRVPAIRDDSFLVIPGDWMELFTNGRVPAVRHRVLEIAEDREAMVFFQNVASMPVGPLERFLGQGQKSRYPTVDSAIPYAGGDPGVPRWLAT